MRPAPAVDGGAEECVLSPASPNAKGVHHKTSVRPVSTVRTYVCMYICIYVHVHVRKYVKVMGYRGGARTREVFLDPFFCE